MKKMLVYPDKAMYHKLDAVLSILGIEQTNDYNRRYSYATYFDFGNSRRTHKKLRSGNSIINGDIMPSNKITVEDVFSDVFGYSSFVSSGECVEKSNHHANKRETCVVGEPRNKNGFVYQKIIGKKSLTEYRCTIVNKRLIICWVRGIRELFDFDENFVDYYTYCNTVSPRDIFYDDEINKIEHFSIRFGIDFADLDIMRDDDGLLYILDVNDTASFHIIRNKPNDLRIIADAFNNMLNEFY